MDALHEWYDNFRNGSFEDPKISVADLKIALADAQLDADRLLSEHQQRKNALKDEIDRLIARIRACEREILVLEEDMKWANELIYTLREWIDDGAGNFGQHDDSKQGDLR